MPEIEGLKRQFPGLRERIAELRRPILAVMKQACGTGMRWFDSWQRRRICVRSFPPMYSMAMK